MIITEENDTYRRTMILIDEQRYFRMIITEENDTYRRTMILIDEQRY